VKSSPNQKISTVTLDAVPAQSATRWMEYTRVTWYVAAVLTLAMVILAIPGYIKAVRGGFSVIQFAVNPSPLMLAINAMTALLSLATVTLCLYLAFLLFRRRPDDRMALFLSFYLLAFAAYSGPFEQLDLVIAASLTNIIWNTVFTHLIMYPSSCFLFLLFPDGRFAPNWSRWLGLACLITAPVGMIASFIWNRSDHPPLAVLVIGNLLPIVVMSGVLYAQYYRYRHLASGEQRQQIKWVLYGLGIMIVLQVATAFPYYMSFTLPVSTPYPLWLAIITAIYVISFAVLPVSLTIAVMRFRLYDIDIIINRTLVYGALTVGTMGIYVLIVGYLGSLFQAQNRSIIAFLTTGLIALLFQPVRQRLQSAVNRFMYGERSDPVFVLSKLGKQMEETRSPHDALDGMVNTVARTLKLPYVAIEFGKGDKARVVASFGQVPENAIQFPIGYQGRNIGSMLVAPRTPGESFDEKDNILLENIARQAGAAAQAAKLTTDLQHSRQKLVTAREEERRRLRRDLHDGIGPTMAGQTLKIDAAVDLILGEPESGQKPDLDEAIKLLTEVKEQTQETVKNIRQIVYALRPPSLDDLGLVAAVQAYIDQVSISRRGLDISLEISPQDLSHLSAAVEVAAYRIVLEALTNVIKHAQADECVVRLSVPKKDAETLHLEIEDNGKGLPEDITAGIGLTSMRERVEELGGSFAIDSGQTKGTHIKAQIPLFSVDAYK
jgi:signal transduction histidine kinase